MIIPYVMKRSLFF